MANNIAHPLIRDGKSQTERLNLRTLAPESVMLDDRSERQLLVYLNEFAKSVAYYNTADTPDRNIQQSNWQNFFRSGSSVQVSLIEAYDILDYENRFDQTQKNFTEGLERAEYDPLFDFLFETALSINGWYLALSSDVVLLDNKVILNETPLRRTIRDLIESNLRPTLEQLVAIANLFVTTQSNDGYRFPNLTDLTKTETDFWQLTPSVLATKDSVLSNLPQKSIEFKRLITERLNDIFRTFAKVIQQIIAAAAKQDILQETRTHEPHLALLYTFLRLFQHVITDFNQLPQKHLDFYFREILGLKPKPLIPDAAHIVFELPKTTPQYKLDKSTLLKDGKDTKGADVRFALDNEIVVNTTQIAELRTLYHTGKFFLARPKANSEDGLGKDFSDPNINQWPTLGSGKNPLATQAQVGLAIVSPSLILENGERTVTLRLNFSAPPPLLTTNDFIIHLSGKKKFFTKKEYEINPADVTLGTNQAIIRFTLKIAEDAIVAADPSVLGVDYGVKGAAVLQLLLVQKDRLYDTLKNLNITSVGIEVKVEKLQNVLVRTDDGDQDPTKPFMPFGAVPSVGSTFSVGSPEIFSKNLTKLTIDYEWDKKPADFKEYYKNYSVVSPLPTGDASFGRNVFLFKDGKFKLKNETASVFDKLIDTPITSFTVDATPSVSTAKDPAWQTGFIAIQLKNDFLHQYYVESLSRQALFLSQPPNANRYFVTKTDIDSVQKGITNLPYTMPDFQAQATSIVNDVKTRSVNEVEKLNTIIAANTNVVKSDVDTTKTSIANLAFTMPDFKATASSILDGIKTDANSQIDVLRTTINLDTTINPPYTPVIKNLTIGYTAEATNATLFHILPFDESKNFDKITGTKPFIFNFEEQGALLIGLSNAVEDSLLPILFQLLESSSDTNLKKAMIEWFYLDGNAWNPLKKGEHILNDATDGFIKTGIIELILPKRVSATSTILPPQYYWLKAASSGNLKAICQTIGVHTQAVSTTFQPSEANDAARLAQPLLAGSIAKLDTPDPNIKAVIQPYDSFGGLPNEDNPHFYRRVSERLRHKGRAVTLFDYEQLVLEAFPEVFKVKCIPHTFSHIQSKGDVPIKDIHFAPGYVTVVVVPNAQMMRLMDPLRPKASRALLERIETFLKLKISPFVRLQVLNPIYENISTTCEVKFREGRSPEYYAEVLKKDIEQFLAPWAFDPTAQIVFGGVVYLSSIVGFIEGREYVDFVVKMTMSKTLSDPLLKTNPNEIVASAARGILSSGEHKVDLYEPPLSAKLSTAFQQRIGSEWKVSKS